MAVSATATAAHTTVVAVPDDGTSPVGTNEWNGTGAHSVSVTVSGVPTSSVDNAVIRADGTGGNLQTSKVIVDDAGGITAGDGTGQTTVAINGNASGVAGGGGFLLKLNGTDALWIGNTSWAFGTAYDPNPTIYAPFIGMPGTVSINTLLAAGLPVYATQWTRNVSDVALANVTTAQNLFASGNDTLSLIANTMYRVDGTIFLERTVGTTSHNTFFALGGTFGDGGMRLLLRSTNPAGNIFAIATDIEMNVKTGQFIAAANTSATENIRLQISGVLCTTTAGTIIPQMFYDTAPGGAPTCKANSYFSLTPMGPSSTAQGGGWA